MFLRSTILLAFCILTSLPAQGESPSTPQPSAQALYEAGKIDEARDAFAAELKAAEAGKNEAKLWQALMGSAWFQQVTGNFSLAIELSNRAFEIATKLDNGYMLGRSLCWLGWNYSSTGLYELSRTFYEQAIEVGAPKGELQIVPVWGLATQELGSLLFRMGDAQGAKTLLERTTTFARERGIDVGVAEGGAHLAEIALYEGQLDDAERFAEEAFQAAVRCGCSHLNTARARLVRAKVAVRQAGNNSNRLERAQSFVEEALRFADEVQSLPTAAEARLILAELLPPGDHKRRIELVEAAVRTLEAAKDERRGVASARLGREYLRAERPKLAAFYIKNGVKVNEEMFRKVDSAYVLGSDGELELKLGARAAGVTQLKAAIDSALSTGDREQASQLGQKLAREYEEAGYDALAIEAAEQSLHSIEKALSNTRRDADAMHALEVKRMLLLEYLSRLKLAMLHSTPSPG